MRSPYPLQWPDGWARTKPANRTSSRFGQGFSDAYKGLVDELRRLHAHNVVITTDCPLRGDGIPYARQAGDGDPGVAVWFALRSKSGSAFDQRVFACDRWQSHAENMRAIAKSIEALRGIDRWGMADVVSKAFAGFAALPPGEPAKPSWRVVFGVDRLELAGDDLYAVVKARHRKLIAEAHPDAGGEVDRAAELNAALDDAERELAP